MAMIPSNYSINVATLPEPSAKYGRHYCSIELGDCMEKEAIRKYEELVEIFGPNYKLDLMHIDCKGKYIRGKFAEEGF